MMSSEYNSLNLSLNFGMMNLMHVHLIYTEFYGDRYNQIKFTSRPDPRCFWADQLIPSAAQLVD